MNAASALAPLLLVPCPWCGATDGRPVADENQGTKWGAVRCSCGVVGPEVRTHYELEENAPWHREAIEAWNERWKPEGDCASKETRTSPTPPV